MTFVSQTNSMLEQLRRDRESGGYGGVITYPEFCELTQARRWTHKMMEDCWADILNCTPVAATTNMELVVKSVNEYEECCSQAKIHNVKPRRSLGNRELSAICKQQASHHILSLRTLSLSSSTALNNQTNDDVRSQDGKLRIMKGTISGSIDRDNACAAPRHKILGYSSASHLNEEQQTVAANKTKTRQHISDIVTCRYAEQTLSSASKIADDESRNPSATNVKMSPNGAKGMSNMPFERLYEEATRRQSMRSRQEAATAILAKESSENKEKNSYPVELQDDAMTTHAKHFRRQYAMPTQSYCYKLIQNNTAQKEVINSLKSTPRIMFQPPPSTPTHIPTDYINAVTRMRSNILRAAQRRSSFEQTLRTSDNQKNREKVKAEWQLTHKPILRISDLTNKRSTKAYVDMYVNINNA